MSKYIIRAEGNGELQESEKLPQEMKEGADADGFVLLTWINGGPGITMIHNIATAEIARIIASENAETEGVIHQAYAIAEGMEKARDIRRKYTGLEGLGDMLKRRAGKTN